MKSKMIIQGKGNLLDAMHEIDPVVTGEFLRLNGNDPDFYKKAEGFMKIILKEDPDAKFLLRSDATIEDLVLFDSEGNARIVSFAGMYDSYNTTIKDLVKNRLLIQAPHDLATQNPETIGNLMKLYAEANINFYLDNYLQDTEDIIKYANFRDVDITDSKMNFILHKNMHNTIRTNFDVESQLTLMCEDPIIKNKFHQEIRTGDSTIDDTDLKWDFLEAYQKKGMFYNDPFGDRKLGPYDHTETLKAYHKMIKGLISQGKIHPDIIYIGEGITRWDEECEQEIFGHIVQLRPGFVRPKVSKEKHLTPKSLFYYYGTIPEEGLIFEFDPETKTYPGLHVIPKLASLYKESKKTKLPLDVRKNTPIKLILTEDISIGKFLSHASLRTIEGIVSLDYSTEAIPSFDKVFGAKKIKYFNKKYVHDGSIEYKRAFKVVEK